MSKFGPSRSELKLRVAMSAVILSLLASVLLIKGLPKGLVGIELFIFGGGFALFLGGTSLWKLMR
ncbi:MAG: hypothetical protein AAGA08_03845 [Pseudomonadota bacterium]